MGVSLIYLRYKSCIKSINLLFYFPSSLSISHCLARKRGVAKADFWRGANPSLPIKESFLQPNSPTKNFFLAFQLALLAHCKFADKINVWGCGTSPYPLWLHPYKGSSYNIAAGKCDNLHHIPQLQHLCASGAARGAKGGEAATLIIKKLVFEKRSNLK